jgi:phage I-like protein
LDSTPAIDALKGSQTQGKAPAGTQQNGLSDTDITVCKQLGIDHDAYQATLAATH